MIIQLLTLCSLACSQTDPQPLILNGGKLPAVHVYHPTQKLPSIVKNDFQQFKYLQDLYKMSQQLDEQIGIINKKQINSLLIQNATKQDNSFLGNMNFRFKQDDCRSRESPLRIRTSDNKKEEIEQTYGKLIGTALFNYKEGVKLQSQDDVPLQRFNLTVYKNPDLIPNFDNCFQLKQKSEPKIHVLCAQDAQMAKSWVEDISHNLEKCLQN